jgi:hypothetical protein
MIASIRMTLWMMRMMIDMLEISRLYKHKDGWLIAHQPTVRYKWDGICPTCGEKVTEEIGKGHENSLRKIYIDCMACSYQAEGWLNPKCKRFYMYGWNFGKRKPDVGIWSETISDIQKAGEDMKYYKKVIDAMIEERGT